MPKTLFCKSFFFATLIFSTSFRILFISIQFQIVFLLTTSIYAKNLDLGQKILVLFYLVSQRMQ